MLQPRPPVVTIMGHVDHGKTTLLDKIRQSNIAARESGGITQHIGASQVSCKNKEGKTSKITFIDTPGHAAFARMRARGAQVTDIAVLLVAADEGVKEQTKESLAHIKSAKVPFLVAISKSDLPAAAIEKVKGQLAEIGVVPEDYGGNITVIPVSGKTGKGVEELLEMLILMGKVEGLKADPDSSPEGVVIESRLDRRRGPLGTVLVKNGTFRLRQQLWIEGQQMKVKAIFDDQGKPLKEAFPSQAVEILGFPVVPAVGALISTRSLAVKTSGVREKKEAENQEVVFGKKEVKLPLIIKSDVQGTLEAILDALPPEIEVIYSGVGDVSDSDIFLAQTAKARVFAFRVKSPSAVVKLAEESGVVIKSFTIIYELLEEANKAVLSLLEPGIEREVTGKAKIIASFGSNRKRIAGCQVLQGEILKKALLTIKRAKEIVGETKITSMKHLKEDIRVARKGEEFGAVFSPPVDFRKGDVIISYK